MSSFFFDVSAVFCADYDVLLDGIFGVSFSGDIRAPFDKIIQVSVDDWCCFFCRDSAC